MSEPKPELRKCTRCHSKILLQYFETNRQGELFKSCNNCRGSHKKQQIEYRENNRELLKSADAIYRLHNKEKIAEKYKLYRENKQKQQTESTQTI